MANKEATSPAPDTKSSGNKPVLSLNADGCFVSVFGNPRKIQGKTLLQYRVTLHRRQRQQNGEFVTKYSFRPSDLERLIQLLKDAQLQIIEHQSESIATDDESLAE